MQPFTIACCGSIQPLQYLDLTLRAQLTGEALAAALVLEETSQPLENIAQIRRLIKDHDGARAEGAARRPQILESQPDVNLVRQQKCASRATHQNRLQLTDDTAADLIEKMPQRDSGLDLIAAGFANMSTDRHQFRAAAFLGAKLLEPIRSHG